MFTTRWAKLDIARGKNKLQTHFSFPNATLFRVFYVSLFVGARVAPLGVVVLSSLHPLPIGIDRHPRLCGFQHGRPAIRVRVSRAGIAVRGNTRRGRRRTSLPPRWRGGRRSILRPRRWGLLWRMAQSLVASSGQGCRGSGGSNGTGGRRRAGGGGRGGRRADCSGRLPRLGAKGPSNLERLPLRSRAKHPTTSHTHPPRVTTTARTANTASTTSLGTASPGTGRHVTHPSVTPLHGWVDHLGCHCGGDHASRVAETDRWSRHPRRAGPHAIVHAIASGEPAIRRDMHGLLGLCRRGEPVPRLRRGALRWHAPHWKGGRVRATTTTTNSTNTTTADGRRKTPHG